MDFEGVQRSETEEFWMDLFKGIAKKSLLISSITLHLTKLLYRIPLKIFTFQGPSFYPKYHPIQLKFNIYDYSVKTHPILRTGTILESFWRLLTTSNDNVNTISYF